MERCCFALFPSPRRPPSRIQVPRIPSRDMDVGRKKSMSMGSMEAGRPGKQPNLGQSKQASRVWLAAWHVVPRQDDRFFESRVKCQACRNFSVCEEGGCM